MLELFFFLENGEKARWGFINIVYNCHKNIAKKMGQWQLLQFFVFNILLVLRCATSDIDKNTGYGKILLKDHPCLIEC